MSEITGKVGKLGDRIEEVMLESGSSVQDAIDVSSFDAEGYTVNLNGVKITDMNTALSDGFRISLLAKIKGGRS